MSLVAVPIEVEAFFLNGKVGGVLNHLNLLKRWCVQ